MGILTGILSCSEEVELATDNKPVPVVYCIFHSADSVYRVLLSKTFNGKLNAYQMAQDTHYIYYQNAKVTLEAWEKGILIWQTELKPVGTTRDTGVFSSMSGYAYETKEVMSTYFRNDWAENFNDQGIVDYLRLVINTPENEEPAYARIKPVFGNPRIEYPVYNYKTLNLCDSTAYYLEFYTSKKAYYDIRCRFRYTEYSDVTRKKELEFTIKANLNVGDGLHHQKITQDQFFRTLAVNFPPESAGVISRVCTSVDLELLVGSQSFKTYIETYHIDNDLGYTLWNCFHGGIGLFAQVSKAVLKNLKMDDKTRDSLANGQYTKHLGFSKW